MRTNLLLAAITVTAVLNLFLPLGLLWALVSIWGFTGLFFIVLLIASPRTEESEFGQRE